MSRIKQTVANCKQQRRKLLIPYLVAGDPDLDTSLALMHELVTSGADIIELGIPFSDPASDGPVIQLAAERSLAAGTRLRDVLALVASFRLGNKETPVVLMGYLNPVEIMGYERFSVDAAAAGVDGVLVVDMPITESDSLRHCLKEKDIDVIFLVAPTTSTERAKRICATSSGYLYYVSLKGVTGAALTDTASVADSIQRLRQFTELPIVVGFGIKDASSAKAMATISDGVIVGSALVEEISRLADLDSLGDVDLSQTVAVIAAARKSINEIK